MQSAKLRATGGEKEKRGLPAKGPRDKETRQGFCEKKGKVKEIQEWKSSAKS